jgi:hypothetical protein
VQRGIESEECTPRRGGQWVMLVPKKSKANVCMGGNDQSMVGDYPTIHVGKPSRM